MIDKKFFSKLQKDYNSYDVGRRIIIKHSNDVLKFSKQAIFAIHREDMKQAENSLNEAKKILKYLQSKIKNEKALQYEGSYLAGIEEFVEAELFFQFIKTGKIFEIKDQKFNTQSYLGGLCDFTGELVRRAIFLATRHRYDEVAVCRQAIEDVVGELIKFNLLGKLRPKYDQAKNNLRKIEEIIYDLEIKRRK
ncbi:MAG TPA: hypothetical protein ENN28_01820 [Candidatus Uhrbacteria bacterium]|nr:hypothetical protein [Candidatus Uhrbacteria bacterium]